MKPYEAILIFDPKIQEDKIDASVAKFEKKIKDSGGTELVHREMGNEKTGHADQKSHRRVLCLHHFQRRRQNAERA